MPKTIIPKRHLTFIATSDDGDPIVCRFVQTGRATFTVQRASNAAELTQAAREVVAAADEIPATGWYECPADLAARAEFEDAS